MLWMALIFFLSSRPTTQVSDEFTINFLFFKSLHVIEYAALYFFMLRGVSFHAKDKRVGYRIAFVLTVLYAISDELHQKFVPTREGKILRDGIIDTFGATLSWIILAHVLPRTPAKLKHLVGKWLTA